MNKYQYALHNLNSFYLFDFIHPGDEHKQREALIANENYKKQLDTLKELVDRFTEEEKLVEIKAPSIRFVPLKKGMAEDELNEYMIGDDSNFLVYLRCKYKSQHEWEYLTEAASPGFDDGICWLNDWWEGQQDVEYLAISKLGERK
jgi:hypothetical protein